MNAVSTHGNRQSFEPLICCSALASPLLAGSLDRIDLARLCTSSDVCPGRVPPARCGVVSPHRDAVHTRKCR